MPLVETNNSLSDLQIKLNLNNANLLGGGVRIGTTNGGLNLATGRNPQFDTLNKSSNSSDKLGTARLNDSDNNKSTLSMGREE